MAPATGVLRNTIGSSCLDQPNTPLDMSSSLICRNVLVAFNYFTRKQHSQPWNQFMHQIKTMATSHVMSNNRATTTLHINDPKICVILSSTCNSTICHAVNNLVTQNIANHNGNMKKCEIIRCTDQSSDDSGILARRPKSPSKSLFATHQG